jgi:hypothetical protein
MSVGVGRLAPVVSRGQWIIGGLGLQLLGAGAPTVYVLTKANKEGLGGHITRATVTLAWREAVHSHAGLAVLIAGAATLAVGSVLMARPFVTNPVTLFLAIPFTAVVGMLALGAAVLVIVLLLALAEWLEIDTSDTRGDFLHWWSGGGSSSKQRDPDDDRDKNPKD